MYYQANIY